MDELYFKEPYLITSNNNILSKIKHIILNQYFKELLMYLKLKNLINDNDIQTIINDFYIYLNDN